MTTPAEDLAHLAHMLEAAGWALSITNGHSRRILDDNLQAYLALARAVEVIGEAANRVSDSTQSQTPQIPWRSIIGMRNHLVHQYDEVNYDTLWEVATIHAASLIGILHHLLPDDFATIPLR